MTRLASLCFFIGILSFHTVFSQEFEVHDNGLIYTDSTMQKLNSMVESLNLKFISCGYTPEFRAPWQARVYHFYVSKDRINEVKKDLERQITPEDFRKKYDSINLTECLAIQTVVDPQEYFEDQKAEYFIEFTLFPGEDDFSIPNDPLFHQRDLKNKWLFKYTEPNSDYLPNGSVEAIYLLENFKSPLLPELYSRQVQYTECLIDTSTTTYLSNEEFSYVSDSVLATRPLRKAFFDYIYIKEPDDFEKMDWKDRMKWEEERDSIVKATFAKNPEFKILLSAAVDEAISSSLADESLEYYAGEYLSPAKKLQLMRLRRVYGSCSMDDSPRLHALAIAQLAAESATWEVFLRSHLDIMNDRFPRATDGSYAWGRRQTYLHELEALGINVPMLMIGISLRVENPAKNHYFGSIGRTGRALSESTQLQEIESKLQQYIADPTLDDFNRLLMYYLLRSISYWKPGPVEDEEFNDQRKRVEASLSPVRAGLPIYMKTILDKQASEKED